MSKLSVKDHPRLYVSPETVANLKDRLHSPFLKAEAARVLRDADRLVRARPLNEGSAPAYQSVTRAIDSRLQCLTCAWVLTRDARYRKAALRHLAHLAGFTQISCEANSATPPGAELPFCLSYGELSATVGLMYDLFRGELTDAEQRIFFAVLDKFLLRAALKALDHPPWWADKEWSNWNGVCAGGMGILALAFHEDLPDAHRLIPFVERSLGPYFQSYVRNGGGCPEGTGYWNYGMNYAMRYALSWERATGRTHPALEIPEIGASLFFPLDFTGVSFGDNDGWHPSCFYFLLARRLKQRSAALNAAAWLERPRVRSRTGTLVRACTGDLLYAADAIPTTEELERLRRSHTKRSVPVARVYAGMDWAALADDEAFPTLRMGIRGGSSAIAGHGMLDLLSFRCRVNGELMITDQQDGGYMATTFSRRGHEIYGRSTASKSSLFVDGLGCDTNVACDTTEIVRGRGLLGVRIDASHIILPRWKELFIGRLFLMVDNAFWLVIDHVLGSSEVDRHWTESRFHTLAEATRGRDGVLLRSGRETMRMTFAALGGGVLLESRGMPSQPTVPQTTIFRWMGREAACDNLQAAALTPGRAKCGLTLAKRPQGGYGVEVSRPGRPVRRIRLTSDLCLES